MKEQLIKLIHHLGLTATRFADEIGVQRSGISHILSGRNQPSYDFIVKITTRYPEISLDWLILGKGSMLDKRSGIDIPQKELFYNETKGKNPAGNENIKPVQETSLPGKLHQDMFTNVNKIEQVIILYADGSFKPYSHPVNDKI